MQRTTRRDPIALHALSRVNDLPETRGLKFSTVSVCLVGTSPAPLRCPISAVPYVVGEPSPDLRRRCICFNALEPQLPRKLRSPPPQGCCRHPKL
jgi:hypothetical protein